MIRVTLIEEFLASYRVPLYERLRQSLEDEGVVLSVLHGEVPREQAKRLSTGQLSWSVQVPSKTFRIGQRYAIWQSVWRATASSDLVVAGHAARFLSTYPMFLRQGLGGPRLALFGHGGNLDRRDDFLFRGAEWVKHATSRHAHWCFAYTSGAAERYARMGVAPERITILQNSIDVTALRGLKSSLDPIATDELRQRLGLSREDEVGLFVGSLYPLKGIEFLIEAAGKVAEVRPRFKLVIAGSGELQDYVARMAETHSWLRYAGRLDGAAKVAAAELAKLLLIPSGVGLVALDGLTLGLPIVTVAGQRHGPEVEYLRDGYSASVLHEFSPIAYAAEVCRLLENPTILSAMAANCASEANNYGIEQMADRFKSGILGALQP